MKGFGTTQAPINVNELPQLPAKVAEEVRGTVDSAYDEVSRSMKRARDVAEDAIDESRRQIKRSPFTAVGSTLAVGLLVGFAIGWLAGNRNRR